MHSLAQGFDMLYIFKISNICFICFPLYLFILEQTIPISIAGSLSFFLLLFPLNFLSFLCKCALLFLFILLTLGRTTLLPRHRTSGFPLILFPLCFPHLSFNWIVCAPPSALLGVEGEDYLVGWVFFKNLKSYPGVHSC